MDFWKTSAERGCVMTRRENKEFLSRIRGLMQNREVRKMHKYPQHGTTSIRVAKLSFWMSRRLPIRFRTQSLIRGAMLHDFYLYDWHKPEEAQPFHGFRHPNTALRNARKHFTLNAVEENVIASHMWPLTLRRVPRCREAVLVCLADKICSLHETMAGWRNNSRHLVR